MVVGRNGKAMANVAVLAAGARNTDIENVLIPNQRMADTSALDLLLNRQHAINRNVMVVCCYSLRLRQLF